MKQTLLILGILLTLTIQGRSQASIKKEKIKALFIAMHQDSLIIKSIDGMAAYMINSMTKMINEPDNAEMMEKMMEKSMQKSKEFALKLVNEDMVDIYDKYFTVEEIEDFTNFYKTKSGQKMLMLMPDITKDIMTIMTEKYQTEFQESFMKEMDEIKEQMKKKK